MTVVLAVLAVAVSVMTAAVTTTAAGAATIRSRAQLAADAAALAAVAEVLPYGDGLPAGAAQRYATSNGARVVECLCNPGATAMQVSVSLRGVHATARAVVDPDLLMPLIVSSGVQGLHPQLASAVGSLVAAGHGAIRIVSGYRSPERQAALWQEALARYGSAEAADDWVAPPGRSMHERGLAVDIGGDLDLARSLVTSMRLPMYRPLPHEPWHYELIGSRGGP